MIPLGLWLGLAQGHVPHDELMLLSAPGGPASDQAAFALVLPHTLPMLFRRPQAGADWALVGGPPVGDDLVGAAALDEAALLLGTRALWSTADGGATWRQSALPASGQNLIAVYEGLWIGGAGGLWRSPALGEPWEAQSIGPISALTAGPGGLLALQRDSGALLAFVSDAWVTVAHDIDSPTAALALPDARYLGDSLGALWRQAGADWIACAPLLDSGEGWPAILRLAADEAGDLWVATASGVVARSADGCATWSEAAAAIGATRAGSGGPTNPAEVARALSVAPSAQLLGGWAGLVEQTAGGGWIERPLVGAAYMRGFALSPDFEESGEAWLGGYAAGVVRTVDGGASLLPPGPGQLATNIQSIALDAAGRLWSVQDYSLARSTDRGATWQAAVTPLSRASQVFAVGEATALIGEDAAGRQGLVAWTTDGETWTVDEELARALDGAVAQGLVARATGLCALGARPTRLVCQVDGAWQSWATGAQELAAGPVVWPQGGAGVAYADSRGTHLSLDGATWTEADPAPGEALAALATLTDDSLLLATRAGALLRSEDGGATWTDLGLSLTVAPFHIRPLPSGGALLATPDRVLWLDLPVNGPNRLLVWSGLERIEAESPYFACPAGLLEEAPTAGLGGLLRLPAGQSATTTVRGRRLTIYGSIDRFALVQVWVDGEIWGELGPAEAPLGALAILDGLEDRPHTLHLQNIDGDGLLIDAIEGAGAGVVFGEQADSATPGSAAPDDDPPTADAAEPRRRCACAAASGAPGAGLLLLALVAARRRR